MRPAELARDLIRFDTTNPPGNEVECVRLIAGLLREAGIESELIGTSPQRPNLIARIPGGGRAAPLLLQGHVDVVTTEGQDWTHPPFAGEVVDGWLWGRGTLDMKGGVAMMVSAFIRAKLEEADLPGDVILAVLADEEVGGIQGARYLAENQPELFAGVRYAIGEGGGVGQTVGDRIFYPIMVSEKRGCQMRVTLRGPGGHGSRTMRGGTMAKLGRLLAQLDQNRLPVHITGPMQMAIERMRGALPGPLGEQIGRLLDPEQTDAVIDSLGGEGIRFDPLLHNTVNATIVRGGNKINVIPSTIELMLDGRLLPGFGPEDMLRELREVIGDEPEVEVVTLGPAQPDPDLGLLDTLGKILEEAHPGSVPIPFLTSGGTDARHFAPLGIRTFGFLPLNLPPGFDAWSTYHNADERVPVEALEFGAAAVYQALLRFHD
jgi:acetylornithine deacetylase/succinyl-diaminopimelate desuccinylase-like protein